MARPHCSSAAPKFAEKNPKEIAWHKHWPQEMAHFQLTASSTLQCCRGASGGWDVQQDTRNTCGSSQAEPLAHPAPGTVQLAPHGIARPKWTSAVLPLCWLSVLHLVIDPIFQHLLEHFLTNSAGKQGRGEPRWVVGHHRMQTRTLEHFASRSSPALSSLFCFNLLASQT